MTDWRLHTGIIWKTYTRQGILAFLHREGFVFKNTKKIPSKANKEAQALFLTQYKELKQSLRGKKSSFYRLSASTAQSGK